jgi:hypothetical protein
VDVSAIDAASGWLPMTELPFPPTYHQINPVDMVLVIALTSDSMPMHAITEFAATALIPKLSEVEGVGSFNPGRPGLAVRLQVNPGSWLPLACPRRCTQGHHRDQRCHVVGHRRSAKAFRSAE